MSMLRGERASGITEGFISKVLKARQDNKNSMIFPTVQPLKSDAYPPYLQADCDATLNLHRDVILKQLKEDLEKEMRSRVYDFRTDKEIHKLDKLLTERGIPHSFGPHPAVLVDGWRICYPSEFNIVLSAVDFEGSHGHDKGLIEITGLLTPEEKAMDDVLGYQTAEQVLERILKHYESDYIDPSELLSEDDEEDSGSEFDWINFGNPDMSMEDVANAFRKINLMHLYKSILSSKP